MDIIRNSVRLERKRLGKMILNLNMKLILEMNKVIYFTSILHITMTVQTWIRVNCACAFMEEIADKSISRLVFGQICTEYDNFHVNI